MSEYTPHADPWLVPYIPVIRQRSDAIKRKRNRLTRDRGLSLYATADYHLQFGLHRTETGWVFREWAPNASSVHIIGDRTGWAYDPVYALVKTDPSGIWERTFSDQCFRHLDLYRLKLSWQNGHGDRLPTAATRIVQDSKTLIFNAQVWDPPVPYTWKLPQMSAVDDPLLVYEAHVGMAQEDERVGTYDDFRKNVLPRIHRAGYNTLQLMAIQEHPYYASFGYHVSGFFAPSSRFGTPDEFRALVDAAHQMGIRVLIDLVHSHAARNEVEGLACFDGTRTQFFYPGDRGIHPLWDSCCFNYRSPGVLRFLLSNCRYWLEAFKVDGFRFDGVTSMLFTDHGANRAFVSYADYFGEDVDIDALAYLSLANELIHDIHPGSVTIAEDVSGYPGMASPMSGGGIGFDYRFAMGVPDFWIKILKTCDDDHWPLDQLWYELNARRDDERTISYCESHDQALVGDQTLMMRLMGGSIYSSMRQEDDSLEAFRGVALHKMIRLITLACAGHGYLNFMGNEFGHPEWIDFPTARNQWSYRFARRQWSLADDKTLYFSCLFAFDRAMIRLVKNHIVLGTDKARLCHLHQDDNVIVFERGNLLFAFNFHHSRSFADYGVPAPAGKYRLVLHSDAPEFGGKDRLLPDQEYFTLPVTREETICHLISLYLPSRTALVLKKQVDD